MIYEEYILVNYKKTWSPSTLKQILTVQSYGFGPDKDAFGRSETGRPFDI